MSDTWFNLRVLLWHLKIIKGSLFKPTFSYNHFWLRKELLISPIWLHTFEPVEGWRERNSQSWRAARGTNE